MPADRDELIQTLVDEMGLTPYEAKAYVAILYHGPLTPKGVNQKSGIPRPRTYDVLNSLVGKGLLMEQPGKPPKYSAVDPKIGLKKLMEDLEEKMVRDVKHGWTAVESLVSSLSGPYTTAKDETSEEDLVWVTRKDRAMIARYSEAIRSVRKELVVATALATPPDKEVLAAVRHILKRKKSSRVIRPIGSNWSKDDLNEYGELIKLGDDIRHLEYAGLTFAVFDRKEVVLWLPPHPSTTTVWIKLPQLAEILMSHFETLWEQGKPAGPLLKEYLVDK
ncbi:MAG: TrmB family transcriptional regulator [Candidatus Thorarchaeota archaeon]|nr:MAG: TrmB family transcriptional regulator [Candidatus Thorarchaeota archaeon]